MESVSPLGKKLSETVGSVVNSLISSEALVFKTFQESEFATFDIASVEILLHIDFSLGQLERSSIPLLSVRVCVALSKIAVSSSHLSPQIIELLYRNRWCLQDSSVFETDPLGDAVVPYLVALRRLYAAGCIDSSLRSAVCIEAILPLAEIDSKMLTNQGSCEIDTQKLSVVFHATAFLETFFNFPPRFDLYERIITSIKLSEIEREKLSLMIGNLLASDLLLFANEHGLPRTDHEASYYGGLIQTLNDTCQEIYKRVPPQLITVIPHLSCFLYCGVALPRRGDLLLISGMVQTETSRDNMTRFLNSILLSKPLVLQGNIGCGKSFLIRELAEVLGQKSKLIELHVSGQTDCKALIGSYVCSDVPGEFVWQAGIITQAVILGHWLVIEDIDKAPLDFISAISSLLEFRKLALPHVNKIIDAHPSFRIIGTRILEDGVGSMGVANMPSLRYFSNLFIFVDVNDCSIMEIDSILTQRYSNLPAAVKKKLLLVYRFLRVNKTAPADESEDFSIELPTTAVSAEGISLYALRQLKHFTLRELMKVSSRISLYSNEFNQVTGYLTDDNKRKSLQEVLDVFTGSIRDPDLMQTVSVLLANIWEVQYVDSNSSLIPVSTYGGNNKGDVNESNEGFIRVGRVLLPLGAKSKTTQQRFANTKQSLVTLEKIAVCVSLNEPVLLVGETGTGKTTAVQELAELIGKKLIVQNLSLSTDVSDLMGGYRPVTVRQHILPLYESFVRLFQATLSSSQNSDYLQVVAQLFGKKNWKKLLEAFIKAADNAMKKLDAAISKKSLERANIKVGEEKAPKKSTHVDLRVSWSDFRNRVIRLQISLPKISEGFAFSFFDGLLVEAMKNGYWVLLDEINLASSETLQGLSSVLDAAQEYYFQSEKGGSSLEEASSICIRKHKDFRIFAAMNPPNDIGKRELPLSLRGRFTEFYVEDLVDKQDLLLVVEKYLGGAAQGSELIETAVDVYLRCREMAMKNMVDGAGLRPHYSLRSLTRCMQSALSYLSIGLRPLSRTLFEAFRLNFSALLAASPQQQMNTFLKKLFCPKESLKDLDFPPHKPGGRQANSTEWMLIKPFWIRAGAKKPVDLAVEGEDGKKRFVLTPTVEGNLRNIAAAIAANVAPILLQGPTSVGKTSMIEYLAARSGNKCVRINNHEHTDVQEYIGGYVTNSNGQLEFKDGLLLEAMRSGHWIILDELNLAPSDVLEALNRLLDDNKELFIAETGEFVKPSPGFLLFATQNPPGVYGGRKPLSRAFKNRFLEINVSDLPLPEVETIICHACGIALKFASMLVKTMHELQIRRQKSSLFQGKYGSITTRDLIRWGRRELFTVEDVVREGFMLIAERLRFEEEKEEVLKILNQECRTDLVSSSMYRLSPEAPSSNRQQSQNKLQEYEKKRYAYEDLLAAQEKLQSGELRVEGVKGIAITESFQRMWTLVGRCISYDEPALLIGETGCGKTAVCQLFAAYRGQRIRVLNCHQSIETADIIGSLRPIRGREAIKTTWLQNFNILVQELTVLFPNDIESDNNLVATKDLILQFEKSKDLKSDLHLFKELTLKNAADEVKSYIAKKLAAEDEAYLTLNPVEEEIKNRKKFKRLKVDTSIVQVQVRVEKERSHKLRALSEMCEQAQQQWIRLKSLFEWQDGPLVTAMKEGDIFLMDEINLAEDAVIERLNSVLEGGRSITLAEKGGQSSERLVAHPNFQFLATMNPSGDFGKRELSPALRSRFTEIWIPAGASDHERILIIKHMLLPIDFVKEGLVDIIAKNMVVYLNWMNNHKRLGEMGKQISVSTREILAWTNFINQLILSDTHKKGEEDVFASFVHGAHMVILDGLGMGNTLTMSKKELSEWRHECSQYLLDLCPSHVREAFEGRQTFLESSSSFDILPNLSENTFSIGSFSIPCKNEILSEVNTESRTQIYAVDARKTVFNLGRILRAMQSPRPILLEGPPGVGKTSLIANLAALTGHCLTRVNLSEHSELSDLLGCDLPCAAGGNGQDGDPAQFRWCDGVFLRAMKQGHWVLLDELNLAPQSVLEGLNSCFDHREEVFLPEIGQVVHCAPSFRVFCAQNPVGGGGGRKGLPQSFLTRFNRVFVEEMSAGDYLEILTKAFTGHQGMTQLEELLPKMVEFIRLLTENFVENSLYGSRGSPWEFNLRDIFRWSQLILATKGTNDFRDRLMFSTNMLFVERVRTIVDKRRIEVLFELVFSFKLKTESFPSVEWTANSLFIGTNALLTVQHRPAYLAHHGSLLEDFGNSLMMSSQARLLEMIGTCVTMKWPVLLTGPAGSGKRKSLQMLAAITGSRIAYFSASPSTDSSELLGSYEQAAAMTHIWRSLYHIESALFMPTGGRSNIVTGTQRQLIGLLAEYRRVFLVAEEVATNNSLSLEKGEELIAKLQDLLELSWEALPTTNSGGEKQLETAREELQKAFLILERLEKGSGSSSFEWEDGILLNAIREGHWFVVGDANLCPSAVLDRLNSLLEPQGSLLLTEGGGGGEGDIGTGVIVPHENFRVFLLTDPSLGEVSRAMRNRCVEISVGCTVDTKDQPYPSSNVAAGFGDAFKNGLGLSSAISIRERFDCSSKQLVSAPISRPERRLSQNLCNLTRLNRLTGQDSNTALLSAFRSLRVSSCQPSVDQGETSESCGEIILTISRIAFFPESNRILSVNALMALHFVALLSDDRLNLVSNSSSLYLANLIRERLDVHGRVNMDENTFLHLLDIQSTCHNSLRALNFEKIRRYAVSLLASISRSEARFIRYALKHWLTYLKLDQEFDFFFTQLENFELICSTFSTARNHTWKLKMINICYFCRSELLYLEKADIDNIPLLDTNQLQSWSLYSISFALFNDILAASNLEFSVLQGMFNIVRSVDFFIQIYLQNLTVAHLEDDENIFNNLEDLLFRRDGFVRMMIQKRDVKDAKYFSISSEQFGTPLRSLKWAELTVNIRWIEKAITRFTLLCREVELAYESFVKVSSSFDNLVRQYWSLTSTASSLCGGSKKIRLWKDGGHAAVPSTLPQWQALQSVRRVMELSTYGVTWDETGIPSFVVTTAPFISGNPLRELSALSIGFRLFKDWLALLATFYWSFGGLSDNQNSKANQILSPDEMKELTNTMEARLRELVTKCNLNGESVTVKRASWCVGTSIVIELVVIRSLQMLMDGLSFVIRIIEGEGRPSVSILRKLISLSQNVIDFSIRYTYFDLSDLREFQTLAWLLDAVSGTKDDIKIYAGGLRSILSSAAVRLGRMMQFNIVNHPSLARFYYEEDSDAESNHGDGDNTRGSDMHLSFRMGEKHAIRTAESRLFQPVVAETVMKYIDISVFFSNSSRSNALRSAVLRDGAEFRLSSYKSVKSQLSELFCAVVVAGNLSQLESATFPAINSLLLLALDILNSCRDVFAADSNILSVLKRFTTESNTSAREAFAILNSMKVSDSIPESYMAIKKLFLLCLEPVFENLSKKDVQDFPFEHIVAIGKCWALIGVVRVHFLVPSLPVDPAARPAVKQKLYEAKKDILKSSLQVEVIHNAMAYRELFDENMLSSCREIEITNRLIENVRRKAVERPPSAADFKDVYLELLSGVNSLVDVNRIVELLREVDTVDDSAIELKAREEISLQDSIHSFIDRLRHSYAEYEDVVVPVMSALSNVSSGLRLAVGHAFSNSQTRHKPNQSHQWMEILAYPLSIFVPLTSYSTVVDSINVSLLSLLQASEGLCSSVVASLAETKELNPSLCSYLEPDSVRSAAPHILSLLALCRIDYFAGTKILEVDRLYDTFQVTVMKLVQVYLTNEEEKRKKAAEKAAMYKYRTQTSTFKSDEVKDIEEDLRKNFPSHLKEIEDKLGTVSLDGGGEDRDFEVDDDEEVNRDKAAEAEDGEAVQEAEEEEHNIFSDEASELVVELHCRMTFIFKQDFLERRSAIWRSSSVNGVDRRIEVVHCGSQRLQQKGCEYTLLTCKMFESSLPTMTVDLDSRTRGGLLMALSLTMNCCDSNPVLQKEPTISHNNMRKFKHHADAVRAVDRDLQFLLGVSEIVSDFHKDSNPSEAARLTPCLEKTMRRTEHLLELFPGNELLLQVKKVAAGISSFHISSPIGKLLTGLQVLLKKAQEWEGYAARHVSLEAEMADMRRLIASWRELELGSWQTLLRCKEMDCCRRASKIWFMLARMFSAVPFLSQSTSENGNWTSAYSWKALEELSPSWLFSDNSERKIVENVVDNDDMAVLPLDFEKSAMSEESFLKSVFGVLDGLLRTATVGEFPTKLHLVRLFALQLLQQCEEEGNKEVSSTASSFLRTVGSLSYGLWRYYEQFLWSIRSFQALLLGPIQEGMKGEVRLGKWDQMSVVAVVEHSEKAHRRLNKRIREYQKDVLAHPVSALLRREIMGGLVDDNGEPIPSTSMPSQAAMFPLLSSSSKTDSTAEIKSADLPQALLREIKSTLIWAKYSKEDEVLEESNSSLLSEFPRLTKLSKLRRKVSKFLKAALIPKLEVSTVSERDEEVDYSPPELVFSVGRGGASYGYQVAVTAEGLCDEIFSRLKALQELSVAPIELPKSSNNDTEADDTDKEAKKQVRSSVGAIKSMKLRAVSELLGELASQGLSSLRSQVPNQLRDNVSLLSVQNPLSIEILGDLEYSSFLPRDILEKGESYYFRNMVEVAQLRVHVSAGVSKDISQRDIVRMLGYAENMFCESLKLRCAISAGLTDFKALDEKYKIFLRLTSDLTQPAAVRRGEWRSGQVEEKRRLGNALLQLFVQLQLLVRAAGAAHSLEGGRDDPLLARAMGHRLDCNAVSSAVQAIISDLSALSAPSQGAAGDSGTDGAVCLSEECLSSWRSSAATDGTRKEAETEEEVLRLSEAVRVRFEAVYPDLVGLVSADVAAPLQQRLSEFLALPLGPSLGSPRPEGCEEGGQGQGQGQGQGLGQGLGQGEGQQRAVCGAASDCMDLCLVAVQNVRAVADRVQGTDGTLADCMTRSIAALASIRSARISDKLASLCEQLQSAEGRTMEEAQVVSDMRHILGSVLRAQAVLLNGALRGYKAVGKLCYVCLRLFRNLTCKGICSPPHADKDDQEDKNGQEGAQGQGQDLADGTGMGEGEGQKDVSDQIENEEQLLGLKKDESDPPDMQTPEERQKEKEKERKQLGKEEVDKGVEMMQDFDGDMMDLPDERTDDGSSDQDDDKEQPDKEMGEADMQDIVDEKQWEDDDEEDEDGDGEKDRDGQGQEKFEKDSKMKGEALDGEMHTKEDQDKEKDNDKDKEKDEGKEPAADKPSESEDQSGDQEQQDEEGRINEDLEENYMEKQLGLDPNKRDQDQEQEQDQDQEQGDAGEGEKGEELPDQMEIDGQGDAEDSPEEPMDETTSLAEEEKDQKDPGMDENGLQGDDEEKEMDKKDDPFLGQGGAGDEPQVDSTDLTQPPPDLAGAQGQTDRRRPPAFGVKAANGQESILDHSDPATQDGDPSGQRTDGPPMDAEQTHGNSSEGAAGGGGDGGSGQGSTGTQAGQVSSPSPDPDPDPAARAAPPKPYRDPPNPFRQSGDIHRSWHRRLDVSDPDLTQDGPHDDNAEDNALREESQHNSDGKGQFEYVQKTDSDPSPSGEQVLADVAEEDALHLPDLTQNQTDTDKAMGQTDSTSNEQNEQKNSDDLDRQTGAKREREQEGVRDRQTSSDKRKRTQESETAKNKELKESSRHHEEEDQEDGSVTMTLDDQPAEAETEDRQTSSDPLQQSSAVFTQSSFKFGEKDYNIQAKDDLTQPDPLDKYSEENMNESSFHFLQENDRTDGRLSEEELRDRRSASLRIKADTQGYAAVLCEQLRLVLAPTLCTRLQGDYRSGKRINMRKVVGYVSSGFRKDKIWMRRTKPAKREYQVMMMIDDSRSMGEAGPLALRALSTISSALTRLDLADSLSIASFAQDMRILHPFGSILTEEKEISILSQFSFSASQTMLANSLKNVVPIFETAKSSLIGGAGGGEGGLVLQICFVISDARIDSDNRGHLERIIRGMAEKHILVVLVIIDRNADAKDSIFNTKTVSFKGDKVSTAAYLDDFPFPYYVAIQQVQALPQVLSDALKQWFELIRGQTDS